MLRRAACCVGEWRGAAVCVSLYDDTNTILRFHSTESDESSGALWCFLVYRGVFAVVNAGGAVKREPLWPCAGLAQSRRCDGRPMIRAWTKLPCRPS